MAEPLPILVLQMQRMGDLILSFPLFLWLARQFPGHPVWVAAEESFYADLKPLSPAVTYIPWSGADFLKRHRFRLILNLSIQPKAAHLAQELAAEEKLGPLATPGGPAYIRGDWQLYRASVVRNNRHNQFHWADLNALDLIGLSRMAATAYDPPRTLPPTVRKVGVFFGASDPVKRPVIQFWQVLLNELMRRGLEPVLLGGPAEAAMARDILKGFGGPVQNACGGLSLSQLAALCQTLSLFITPDTGPMHLAAWAGTRVLNLSMGNVNAWETGPYQPGHYVLSTRASCSGCWECRHAYPYCQWKFAPRRIAFVAARLAAGDEAGLSSLSMPGVTLWRTGRNGAGLYHLDPVGKKPPAARLGISDFWTRYFGWAFKACGPEHGRQAFELLARDFPALAGAFRAELPGLARRLSMEAARGRLSPDFHRLARPMLRPLTGYLELGLGNADYAPGAVRRALEMVEGLSAMTAV